MFINIKSNNIFFSEGDSSEIRLIEESYYINLNRLIHIEFNECLLKVKFSTTSVKLEYKIKLFVLVEEGVWNFITLYFPKKSYKEFQKIKKVIERIK